MKYLDHEMRIAHYTEVITRFNRILDFACNSYS